MVRFMILAQLSNKINSSFCIVMSNDDPRRWIRYWIWVLNWILYKVKFKIKG